MALLPDVTNALLFEGLLQSKGVTITRREPYVSINGEDGWYYFVSPQKALPITFTVQAPVLDNWAEKEVMWAAHKCFNLMRENGYDV